MELTEASPEETEERLKNEQYQLVSPLKWKRSTETSPQNTENQTPSKKEESSKTKK